MQGQRRSLLVARIEDTRKSQDRGGGGGDPGSMEAREVPLPSLKSYRTHKIPKASGLGFIPISAQIMSPGVAAGTTLRV